MSKLDDLAAASRRKAEELLNRSKEKETERIAIRDRQRQAEDAKTSRLRELRLAKEAAERTQRPAKPPRAARRKKPTA
jgi:hypothetical protein